MTPREITLVTGNTGKLQEWQRLVPSNIALDSFDINLDEIQSLDLIAIITDKAKRAYDIIGKPIIVEDVSAGLDKLGGLPGPFIKFFEEKLGRDALFQLAEQAGDPMTVQCVVAYYDGKELITAIGEIKGTVAASRDTHGFGFDLCFIPTGQTKTYGEMSAIEKNAVSHRAKAIKQLVEKL
jgi:inosine triphosphate pyrophosphatase